MTDTSTTINYWALLVGIDHYPDPTSRLRGCVNDVLAVKQYLETTIQTRLSTTLLTASTPKTGGDLPEEEKEAWPTCSRFYLALDRISAESNPGDRVVVHFSGLSGTSPDGGVLKFLAEDGLGIRHVRMRRLITKLDVIAQKGILVTLILDSCNPLFQKGNTDTDSNECMEYPYPIPEGVMILAASGPGEPTFEIQVAHQTFGIFTYVLLQTLHYLISNGIDTTHNTVHNHLNSVFRAQNRRQSSSLYGKLGFVIFDRSVLAEPKNFTSVTKGVDGNLILNAGGVQNVYIGDEYHVHFHESGDSVSMSHNKERAANVRVRATRAFESDLDVIGSSFGNDKTKTWSAEPLTSLPSRDVEISVPNSLLRLWQSESHEMPRYMLLLDQNLGGRDGAYYVHINEDNEYEVSVARSQRMTSFPPISRDSESSSHTVMRILQHIADYKYLEGLQNKVPCPELQASFSIECDAQPNGSNNIEISVGTKLRFDVHNRSQEQIYLEIFSFRSSWELKNLTRTCTIPSSSKQSISVQMTGPEYLLDSGQRSCTDVIMFLITNRRLTCHASLPDIRQVMQSDADHQVSQDNGIDALLSELSEVLPGQGVTRWASRNFSIQTHTSDLGQISSKPETSKAHVTSENDQVQKTHPTIDRKLIQDVQLGQATPELFSIGQNDEIESTIGTESIRLQSAYSLTRSTNPEREKFTEPTEATELTGEGTSMSKGHGEEATLQHNSSTETVYEPSVTDALPRLQDMSYINDLAGTLIGAIDVSPREKHTLDRVAGLLPNLLRAFALKVGYEGQSRMHQDVAYFVRKHRSDIGKSFEVMLDDMLQTEDAKASRFQLRPDEVAHTGEFALDRYLTETAHPEHPIEVSVEVSPLELDACPAVETLSGYVLDHDVGEDDSQSDDQENRSLASDSKVYVQFIKEHPAYDWLVANLIRETRLVRGDPDLMEEIKQQILSALPSSHKPVGRNTSPQEFTATFEGIWDPLLFVKQQQYAELPSMAITSAITLTGNLHDAQAMTTQEYVDQVWPVTGRYMVHLIVESMQSIDHNSEVILPDGTKYEALMNGDKFTVRTRGTGDSLAEAAQQLAWLSAALRSSPFERGVAKCTPHIRSCQPDQDTARAKLTCVFGYEISKPETKDPLPRGHCWHQMFKNPVLVSGFPILKKFTTGLQESDAGPKETNQGSGIEMTLSMMSELTEAVRVVQFQGKLFMKGFSTMLVAVKLLGDILIWHHQFKTDKKRISFLDAALDDSQDVEPTRLGTVRHVVGWSPDCLHYAGAADADYSIRGSRLPSPSAGALLEKVTLSGGKYVVGATIAVGAKDRSEHINPEAYFDKLKYMDTRYVVLWDEETKRGWLVNGTSALLHLVRSSLKADSQGSYAHRLLFDESRMQNDDTHGPFSAARVLSNQSNQDLEVWPGKTEKSREEEREEEREGEKRNAVKRLKKKKRGYTLFEDRVEQQYAILELVLETHLYLQRKDGVNLKLRARKHLEGWDFKEMAAGQTIRPRVATLHAIGCGWVDFARSIEAVSLFGKGFGDIFKAAKTDDMCSHWLQLPKGHYYLAASMFDLDMIMDTFGNTTPDGHQVINDLIWHSPHDPFARCKCQGDRISKKLVGKHHDRVQVFCPRWSTVFKKPQNRDSLGNAGVVVFGHTMSWPYLWKEHERKDVQEENLVQMPPNMLQSLQLPIDHLPTAMEPGSSVTSTSRAESSLQPTERMSEDVSYTSYSHDSAPIHQDVRNVDNIALQEASSSQPLAHEGKQDQRQTPIRKKKGQRGLSLSQCYKLGQ